MRHWFVMAAVCLGPSLASANTLQDNVNAVATPRVGLIVGGVVPNPSETGVWYFGEQTPGGTPTDDHTAWRLGSATKSFTGFLTALQNCNGVYTGGGSCPSPPPHQTTLPELFNTLGITVTLPSVRQSITLEQMAAHTSGLPAMQTGRICSADDHYLTLSNCAVFRDITTPNPSTCLDTACPASTDYCGCSIPLACTSNHCGPADFCACPNNGTVAPVAADTCQTPGVTYLYSNWAYNILGNLLAANAGKPTWHHLNKVALLTPLGMASTFVDSETTPSGVTKGAGYECTTSCTAVTPIKVEPAFADAAGGLWSTGPDMLLYLKYAMGVLNPAPSNQLVAARGLVFATHGYDLGHNVVGLGWQQKPLTNGSSTRTVWYKAGGGAGFSAYIAWMPSSSLGGAVGAFAIANSGDAVKTSDIVDSVLKNYL